MSHKANLRRLKALTALVAPALFMAGTAAATDPLHAQGTPSLPNETQDKGPPVEILGKPTLDPRKAETGEDRGTAGSWSFFSRGNNAWALLQPEKIKTRSGGKREGDSLKGGQAEIKIEYWSIPGPRNGYSGTLIVSKRGRSGYKTHVFIDGKEVDSFTVGGLGGAGTVNRDLKAFFGENLGGLAKARNLRVTMDVDGTSYDVFEVDFEGNAELLARMRRGPDANYAQKSAQTSSRTSRSDDIVPLGVTGPSSGSGQVGPWHYGSGGGSTADAKLNLKNVNAQGSKKFVQTERGGLLDATPPRGGWANIEVVYEGAPGPKQGFSGDLVVHRIGQSGSYPVHVLVDGKEVDSFTLSEPVVKRDLKTMFGEDLSGFAKAKDIRVTMDIDGKSYDILSVQLYDKKRLLNTAAVTASKMKDWADRNYRLGQEAKEEAKQGHRTGGDGGKKCFITTACCETVGLADDCFELTTLRRFRDRVLALTADGQHDIQLYYTIAPLVLDEMRRRGEEGRLLRLYFSHILPCVLGAKLGLVRAPRRLYQDMMQRLIRGYRPDQLDLMI